MRLDKFDRAEQVSAIVAQRPQMWSIQEVRYHVERKFNGAWYGHGEIVSSYADLTTAVEVARGAAEQHGTSNIRIRIERTEVLHGWEDET